MVHIRVNVATRFCKGSSSVTMQAGRSWLQWTGPAALIQDRSPEPLMWTVEAVLLTEQ